MTEEAEAIATNPNGGLRKKLLSGLALVVLAGALIWGIWYYLTQKGRVHTDNAYVGADLAQVTPLVSGAVKEIRAVSTQMANKGDVLLVLDDADAKVDVATAEAALLQARQRFSQARATGSSLSAKLGARGADSAQAQARLGAAQADYERARAGFARRSALAGSGAVSGEELSIARAELAAARANLSLAQAGIAAASATRVSAGGDLAVNQAVTRGMTLDNNPDVAAAQARLDAARLNLERTTVRAPISGIVTQKQVQLGQRIQAGTPVMTLVPIDAAFVDANFKESQLRDVRPGQPVELTSDYYGSSVVYHGTVLGFAGGTGAAFSLIPAQNATGNWVKVVQRLPVRVILNKDDVRGHPLRVGLSMDATVDTRGK